MTDHSLPPAPAFGEVYDRGYQRYAGPRLGRWHALRALTTYSMKRALGARKSWTAKVIPILLYVAVAIVVVIPIGIRAVIPDANVLEYWEYFGIIFGILGIFVATVAPEMLCNDRRENVLTLYFSRSIERYDYVLAKLLATALLTLTISLVPMLIYWLGRQLLDDAPLAAMRTHAGDLWRIVAMTVLTACYVGAIGLAISSLTGRKAIAVAIIIIGFLTVSSISGLLAVTISDERILPLLVFFSPARLVAEYSHGVFGQRVQDDAYGEPLGVWWYAAGMLLSVAIAVGIMVWRYRPRD